MLRQCIRMMPFGLAYFVVAAVPIALTRLDGGVAFVWIGTALLTARLRTAPRSDWASWLIAAGIASALATGMFGLGWVAAAPLVVFNLTDALVATSVLAKLERKRGSATVEQNVPAIVSACLAGALVTMVPAGLVTHAVTGTPVASNAIHWIIGHALGSLTFGPFMFLCLRRQMRPWLSRIVDEGDLLTISAVALLVATCAVAFTVRQVPLLFLPILALAVLTCRGGLPGAAFGSVLLAIIGGALTLAGHAGFHFGAQTLTFHFLQFYLGATTMTMLPIAAAITARGQMTARLQHSEAGYRLLADNIDDVVVQLDVAGRITYVSPSIRNVTGLEPDEIVGRSGLHLVDPQFRVWAKRAFRKALASRGGSIVFEFEGSAGNAQTRWFEMQCRCVRDSGNHGRSVVGSVRETTGRKMLEAALSSAAETDQLTGLLHRRALFDAARATARSGSPRYLAVFDIDHLDAINLAFGNEVGDQALLAFAAVARRTVGERDLLGRLEGDGFGLVLTNSTRDQAEATCRRILAILASERLSHDGRPIALSASAGLAELDSEVEASLRTARSALARAKANGRARLNLVA